MFNINLAKRCNHYTDDNEFLEFINLENSIIDLYMCICVYVY